jgi:hypothetical protein
LKERLPKDFLYLSGGVSSDEQEVMEERGKSYNVKLISAAKTGAYLTAACSFTEKIASASKPLCLFSSLTPTLTSRWWTVILDHRCLYDIDLLSV